MSMHLRILLGGMVGLYFLLILHFLRKKTLALKYALLWLAAGAGMGALVLFPGLLLWLSGIIGIQSEMNTLFAVGICFIGAILMSLTAIVSKQTEKLKNLTQENALLETKIREQATGKEQEA